MYWAATRLYWAGQVVQVVQVIQVVQVVQVVRVVRMISLDSTCIRKIYGFHGLNHQIIEKSCHACDGGGRRTESGK